jgi:hypothetical protein
MSTMLEQFYVQVGIPGDKSECTVMKTNFEKGLDYLIADGAGWVLNKLPAVKIIAGPGSFEFVLSWAPVKAENALKAIGQCRVTMEDAFPEVFGSMPSMNITVISQAINYPDIDT